MGTVTLHDLQKEVGVKKNLPQFRTGQTVRVHQRIKEGGKERIQIFEGLIIEVSGGAGITGSVTVRRIVDGTGVEKVFPVHSPFIQKIELIKEAKVRRSRIFFMRDRSGKSARLQERFFSESELTALAPHEVTEEEVEEAVEHKKEEEAKKAEESGEEGKAEQETPSKNQKEEASSSAKATEDKKTDKSEEKTESKEESASAEASTDKKAAVKKEETEKKPETPKEKTEVKEEKEKPEEKK